MKTASLLCTTLLLLAGCGTDISVGSDFDSNVDFSTFRSYRWHEGNEFNLTSQRYLASNLADERIRRNVDQELSSKGIRLRDNGPVDFLVNYSVVTADRTDIDTFNTYEGYAPGWTPGITYAGLGPYRYGHVLGTLETETRYSLVTQGTLVIDVIHPIDETLLWRGIAEGKLDPEMNQGEREALISEAVSRLMDGFPPEES